MQISIKSLFVTSLLTLSAQQACAEWKPGVAGNGPLNWPGAPLPTNLQEVPWITPEMMPITWGDCIPVPIDTAPMGTIGNAPMNMGAAVPFNAPAPMNMPAPFPAPSAGPFYGNVPAPMPLPPLPAMEAISPSAPPSAPLCDNTNYEDSKAKLVALQARYERGSAAARNKIEELKQVLNDTQNQLQDSVASLEERANIQSGNEANLNAFKHKVAELEKTSGAIISLKENENAVLKKQLAEQIKANTARQEQLSMLRQEGENLQSQLTIATEASAKQARKLQELGKSSHDLNALKQQFAVITTTKQDLQTKHALLLKQSSAQLNALKQTHQTQSAENELLKKQLADFSSANKTLQAHLGALKTDAASKNKAFLALKQSATQLTSLKQSQQAQSAENETLKKQLVDFNTANKTLQSQLGALKTDAASKNKELLALKLSATQLASLKQAHQAQSVKNETLKKQLADLSSANKTLQTHLGALKTDTASKNKQFLALKLSATQLTSLKQAHQAQSAENDALKKQLADLKTTNKNQQAHLASLKTDAAVKDKEVLGLKQLSSQLLSLKQAYKNQQEQALSLKNQLASSANTRAELERCKTESDELAKKLAASANTESALQAGLSELKNKSAAQAQQIASLTTSAAELDKLKSAYQDLSSKKEALNAKLAAATADNDKDGILDNVDKCPASPAGAKVNEKGCPVILDNDNDGVADASDLCPSSGPGAKVNEFGCTAAENITLKGVNFKTGSARLTNTSLPILDAAAETLKRNPGLKIEVSGHTDNEGQNSNNLRLSQVRANTVMIYLIRQGVTAQSLTAKGYGDSQAVASNDTAEGRATNRRVELKILK